MTTNFVEIFDGDPMPILLKHFWRGVRKERGRQAKLLNALEFGNFFQHMLDAHLTGVLFELLPGRSSMLKRRTGIISLGVFPGRLLWRGELVLPWQTRHEQGIEAFPCFLRQL